MKRFAFVSAAAEREYKALPADVQDGFGNGLRYLQYEESPPLPLEYLESVGAGVAELKINGSPAFRCVYVAKYLDTVVVLHSFTKTTNGTDQKALSKAKKRLKELQAEMRSAI